MTSLEATGIQPRRFVAIRCLSSPTTGIRASRAADFTAFGQRFPHRTRAHRVETVRGVEMKSAYSFGLAGFVLYS